MPPRVKVEPVTTAVLGHGVGGEDAARRVLGAVPRQASSPASASPSRITSIGSGVPMIPVEQTRTCLPCRCPSASAAASLIASASARPAAPVPALALPELTMIALALPPFAASRSRSSITGGATNLLLGEDGDGGDRLAVVGRDQRHVVARFLIPAWQPAATKPWGGGDAHGQTPTLERPAVLVEAEHEIGALDHLAGGSFHEIVERGDGEHAAGALVVAGGEVDRVRAQGPFGRGRPLRDMDEGLVRIGLAQAPRAGRRAPSPCAVQVARMPRFIGARCGVNRIVPPSSISISAVWRWSSRP